MSDRIVVGAFPLFLREASPGESQDCRAQAQREETEKLNDGEPA